jgi:hypothetical protein
MKCLFVLFYSIFTVSITYSQENQTHSNDDSFYPGVFKAKKVIGYCPGDSNPISNCDYQKEYRVTKDSLLYINRCDADWLALQKGQVKTKREYYYGKIEKTTIPSRYTCSHFYLIFSKFGLVIMYADYESIPATKTIITEKIR